MILFLEFYQVSRLYTDFPILTEPSQKRGNLPHCVNTEYLFQAEIRAKSYRDTGY